MSNITTFDLGIVGGGLAGLALSIEAAKKGRKVILFEKQKFPYHKVCGEYISNESWRYIEQLGVDLDSMNLPQINQLKITSSEGAELNQPLRKGGFGISRFTLDFELVKLAKSAGVVVSEETKVNQIETKQNEHVIHTENNSYQTKLAIGCYGKRSNLDKQLNRRFITKPLAASRNYVGIKYHVKANLPDTLIGLHLFKDGYCGISKIEGEDRYCMCYLTLASNLQQAGNVEKMETEILSKNPYLKEYLQFERFYDNPLVISQINFSKKASVENGIFMLGDAAGLIVPLCGNGMSMALKAANSFHLLSEQFFDNKLSKNELEREYTNLWKKEFSTRLYFGRILQGLFYKKNLVNISLKLLDRLPKFTNRIIGLTHGKDIA